VPPNIRVEGVDVSYPSLQIENTGNFALIRWSTNVFGFILEYTDDMNSTNWQTISQQPVRIDSYFVYPTSTVGAQFYRLRRQVE
jgi:hypothetical protein